MIDPVLLILGFIALMCAVMVALLMVIARQELRDARNLNKVQVPEVSRNQRESGETCWCYKDGTIDMSCMTHGLYGTDGVADKDA